MKLLEEQKGSVAIEAALALPVMVLLLVAMIEFGQGFTAKRRMDQVASMAADLVARAPCVTQSDLVDVAKIGKTILQPYASTPLGLRITSVDAKGAVQWSFGSGTLKPAKNGANISLPAGLSQQGKPLIVANASYAFTPVLGRFLASGHTFSTSAYNYSRLGGAVPLQGVC